MLESAVSCLLKKTTHYRFNYQLTTRNTKLPGILNSKNTRLPGILNYKEYLTTRYTKLQGILNHQEY